MTTQRLPYPKGRPVFPSPAGLITSVDADGRPNIITLGEVFNLSIADPVIVGIAIAPPRYSHQLISQQGEYVINLPPASLVKQVWACGSVSGREVDKFARFGLTPIPATHVKPPLIAECIVNIECRVVGIETIGDHDLFKGEVLAVHISPEIADANGKVDPAKLSTVVLTGFGVFGLGEQLSP